METTHTNFQYTPEEYISKLKTKISYLTAGTSRLEIEIHKYELKQTDFQEFTDNINYILRNLKVEVSEE